jgi:hypothetical protein
MVRWIVLTDPTIIGQMLRAPWPFQVWKRRIVVPPPGHIDIGQIWTLYR